VPGEHGSTRLVYALPIGGMLQAALVVVRMPETSPRRPGALAFSVPAVVAGFAGTAFGLRITAEVYALVIIAIAVAALVLRIAGARRAAA